jgi:hypothetical protein
MQIECRAEASRQRVWPRQTVAIRGAPHPMTIDEAREMAIPKLPEMLMRRDKAPLDRNQHPASERQ